MRIPKTLFLGVLLLSQIGDSSELKKTHFYNLRAPQSWPSPFLTVQKERHFHSHLTTSLQLVSMVTHPVFCSFGICRLSEFVSLHFCLHEHGVCMFWSNVVHS